MNQNHEVKQIFKNTIFITSPEMKHLTLHVEEEFHGHGSRPRIVNTRHLLAKLLDFKDKESFHLAFKSSVAKERDQTDCRFFHSNIQHLKTLETCLKIPKDAASGPRIFYLSKLASKNNDYGQRVWNLQKLEDCCSTVLFEEM